MVNTKDGSDVHTGIDIATAIERIKDDTVFPPVFLVNDDGFFEFFGNQDSSLSGGSERVDHDVVGEDVEFLLFFALNIGVSC